MSQLEDLTSATSGVLSGNIPRLRRGESHLCDGVLTYHNGRNIVDVIVGTGATNGVGSDRYPYTVVEILSPKRVVLQADEYKRIDSNGLSESQRYDFRRNDSGAKVTVSLRKDGVWRRVGESMGGSRYHLGHRDAYSDPSF
jgi:hypothetical protein